MHRQIGIEENASLWARPWGTICLHAIELVSHLCKQDASCKIACVYTFRMPVFIVLSTIGLEISLSNKVALAPHRWVILLYLDTRTYSYFNKYRYGD